MSSRVVYLCFRDFDEILRDIQELRSKLNELTQDKSLIDEEVLVIKQNA
ncbi:MAG: aspartyl-phosphate phosphatase Spo0E family protein [Clostridiales bacterium]|nr:aspartyl-phosphate phosphatase Spo0E family protein [Clostridiales bacterium]